MRLYVGHDGSMIRLASGLGIGKESSKGFLRWPALGSEIVLEIWRARNGGLYVRVMHEGSAVRGLEWVPLADMISKLESNVPSNILERCTVTG
jgi:2-phosphoxylose phosphatase